MSDSILGAFAPVETAKPESVKATYTPTHLAVPVSENVTLQGCKRDSDGIPHIARTTRKTDGSERTTYDRADRVSQYLAALAERAEAGEQVELAPQVEQEQGA